jgi:hypothetical protein
MARVVNMLEETQQPLYDCIFIPPDTTLAETTQNSRLLRFFVDVQNKTLLETNLQNAGVLPSPNSFEIRAMRVVIAGQDGLEPQEPPENGNGNGNGGNGGNGGGGNGGNGNGSGSSGALFLSDLVFNSVTSLIVGEKIMLQVPTFMLPSGAGIQVGDGTVSNHGSPDPLATFRFAEPVKIDPQQNFRVEMLFPNDVPGTVADATGPLRIWVILDGLLKRAVQ